MKNSQTSVNVRIQEFMKRKMAEFPEIDHGYKSNERVVQRVYLPGSLKDVLTGRA